MAEEMTLVEVRAVLASNMKKLQDGEMSAASANAVSNTVGKLLSSFRLEMEYAKMIGAMPRIALLETSDDTPRELRPGETG